MSKTTISDGRVRIKASKKLMEFIDGHKEDIIEIPVNIAKALKVHGFDLPTKIETLEEDNKSKSPIININLLNDLCKDSSKSTPERKEKEVSFDKNSENKKSSKSVNEDSFIYLSDLRWLNAFLTRLRKENGVEIYLHQLLETSSLVLPENEIIKRNPELEARCEKLRQQQQNQEYMKMTKNVDAVLKDYPEDTIAYQMKAINKQIIAVFQFVLSVVAGFVFGFLGIELIIGGLDFGLRLLLGIIIALIIALAEIYFLAKKLNEYDEVVTTTSKYSKQSPVKNKKSHAD